MDTGVARVLDLDAEGMDAARDRLYPDWWMFSDPQARVGERPWYRVVCKTDEERDLAYRVRPPYIDATIVLEAPAVHA
jgi:hypothetical protein